MGVSILLCLVLLLPSISGLTCSGNSTDIGSEVLLELSAGTPHFLCFQLDSLAQLAPVRLLVSSQNVSSRHPVLVTVRQEQSVSSMILPYVESGFSYLSIERTLCPLFNGVNSSILVELSTTQQQPLSVTVSTSIVAPYVLTMNSSTPVQASPSGPAYLIYNFNEPSLDSRVRVNILSSDNTSDICAIASIQTTFCPMVELLDNPYQRGTYQTMKSTASITTKVNGSEVDFGHVYVVLSVLPSNGVEGSCLSSAQSLGGELTLLGSTNNNFDPIPFNGSEKKKNFIVSVERVNPPLDVAIAVPMAFYLIFCIVTLILVYCSVCLYRKVAKKDTVNSTNPEIPMTSSKDNIESNPCVTPEQNPINESSPASRFKVNMHMAELGEIDDSSNLQKEYYHYLYYLVVIIVFYSIPAYQLVVTYQKLLVSSGNEDICYYNSLCASPIDIYSGLTFSAFNNIVSNTGYVILAVLYISLACIRRTRYKRLVEKKNCECDHNSKTGVPQTFGIYYAIGVVMIAQAFMSVAYHICPSSSNYQFDATFMYVMAVLGMFKVLVARSPDLAPALHRHALFLMIIIVVVVLGGIWFRNLAFQIVFAFVYLITTAYYCVEVYYRWQIKLKPKNVKEMLAHYKNNHPFCPPQHLPKFVALLIVFLLNAVIALGIFATRLVNGVDFPRYFVLIVLVNFLIYLIYYLIAKCVYRECNNCHILKPLMYTALAFVAWAVSIYFFTQDVTDTSVSPALSRDKNKDCIMFDFYDSHDMWHFLSAIALFFSFSILITLDEGQQHVPRTEIKTF